MCVYTHGVRKEDCLLLSQADLGLQSHFIAPVQLFTFCVVPEFANMNSKVIITSTSESCLVEMVAGAMAAPCGDGQVCSPAHSSRFSCDPHGPSLQLCQLLTRQWRPTLFWKEKPFWEPHCFFPRNVKTSSGASLSPIICDSAECIHWEKTCGLLFPAKLHICSWNCWPQGSAPQSLAQVNGYPLTVPALGPQCPGGNLKPFRQLETTAQPSGATVLLS